MAYLGNSPVLSQQEYRNIDNISGSFNGVTTSFPLLVNGVAPVPAPQSSNQCLISVNGVVQKPDDTGASGFRLSGGNIVFSAAPTGGQSFFGVILAGADYIYAGSNFPDGTVSAPSITFAQDLDTGFYRSGAGEVKFTANGTNVVTLSANNLTAPSFIPTSSTVPSNGVYLPSSNNVAISTNGSGRLFIDSTGNVGVGAAPSTYKLDVFGAARLNSSLDASLYLEEPGANIVRIKAGTSASFIGTTSNHPFYFVTNNTERLRITSTGAMNFVGAGTAGSTQAVSFNGSAPVNSLVIDSSGRVGLGTSSVVSKFQISNSGAEGYEFNPGDAANVNATFHYNRTSSAWIANRIGASYHRFDVSGSESMRLTSTGLGIGTTAPATTLEVNGTSYVTDLLIRNNAGTPSLGTSPWLYSPASGALAIATNASERVRIDSSGRLLVGTSTARTNFNTGAEQSHIQLEGTTFNTSNLSIVRNSANDGTAALTLGKSRSATVNGNTVVVSGDPLGFINFEGADGTNMVRGASITAQVDGTPGTNDMPGRLVFSTTADGASSPTERMRIRNDGHIVTYDFGSLANPTTGMVAARGFSTRTGVNGSYVGNAFNFNWTGNLVAYIDSTNIGNVTLTSDYRIKRNIEDQAGEAIARIKQLRPVTYQRADYGDLIKGDDRVREGFIAHEVAEVIPSGVEGEKDAENQVQSLNIDAIVSVLTKALQEAVAKIETLEAKVAALEAS